MTKEKNGEFKSQNQITDKSPWLVVSSQLYTYSFNNRQLTTYTRPFPSMITDIAVGLQRIVQVLFYQHLRRQRRGTDNHLYIVLGKKIQGPCSHSAGNNHIGSKCMQPFWQYSGLMGWRDQGIFAFNLIVFNFHQCKFLTMPEMGGEFSFC